MNNLLRMDTDYKDKIRKKILDNGKNNIQSVYSGGPFTVVPRRALNDKRIAKSPIKYLVLSVLCSCANNYTGVCFPTYQYIGNQVMRDKSSVSRAIKSLIEWGYIKRLRKGSPLYKNVKHKSSVYRILYDPLMNDKEVHSRALINDEELQQIEQNDTIRVAMKPDKKTQRSCSQLNKEVALSSTKTRLNELDLNNNNRNTIKENKLNEMEMMKKFQNIHLKIYQTTFQPDRRDWRQMTELIKHQDATSALLTKIENILRKKKKPPVFPISYILACLKPEPTTVKEVMKDLAKAMRPKRRLKFD